MSQRKIDKTKEEIYQILINTKDKKSFAQAFGYKDTIFMWTNKKEDGTFDKDTKIDWIRYK